MVESNSKSNWLWSLSCLTFHFELPKWLIPQYLLANLPHSTTIGLWMSLSVQGSLRSWHCWVPISAAGSDIGGSIGRIHMASSLTEIIKTHVHHLAYTLSCFLGLLISMKQVALLERPLFQGTEGGLWPTTHKELNPASNNMSELGRESFSSGSWDNYSLNQHLTWSW